MNILDNTLTSTEAEISQKEIQSRINECRDQIKNFKREWTEYITKWSNALVSMNWKKVNPMNEKLIPFLNRLKALEDEVDLLSYLISHEGLTPYFQLEIQKLQRSLGDRKNL